MDCVLRKLRQAGMVINAEKTVLKAFEITFLGYRISKEGIKPDDKLVSKMLKAKEPKSRKELDAFIGLVNYYGRHINKFAEIMQPLNDLRKKGVPFSWNENQQQAFDYLKKVLSTKPVIGIFDINKEVTLTTDASEKALSGILSQNDHPVFYMSRKLTASESKYSNIEREALAIVWCTNRARSFLLGRKFKLISDHLPLHFLFNPHSALPKVTSARIQRWALHMAAFDYEIEYMKGEKIPHTDALNRLDFETEADEIPNDDESFIHWVDTDVLQLDQIRDESTKDKLLSYIFKRVKRNRWSNCSVAERPFKQNRKTLSVAGGVLCRGEQIVPPKNLREQILAAIHDDTHGGVNSTRNRLRLQCWWPGYCEDVEMSISKCEICAKIKKKRDTQVHSWPSEEIVCTWTMPM